MTKIFFEKFDPSGTYDKKYCTRMSIFDHKNENKDGNIVNLVLGCRCCAR